MCPQAPRLFSATVRDNILLGMPEEAVDLPAALRFAVLEHDVTTFEHGLDTEVGSRGVKLSGGQAQPSGGGAHVRAQRRPAGD